jgi:hypothetical protein
MKKDLKYQQEQEANGTGVSLATFVAYYNENIPTVFPRASVGALQKFKADHPRLFEGSDEWTVDRHRKRVMDWLLSNSHI